MKIFDMPGYIPYPTELSTRELGYNIADDTLHLKVDSDMVKRILIVKTDSDSRYFPQYTNNSGYEFKEETNGDWRIGRYDGAWKQCILSDSSSNGLIYLNNAGNERKIVFADVGNPDVTIASGNNSNGYYLKLPSGVLVCWSKKSLTFEKTQANVFGTTAGDVKKGHALDIAFPVNFTAAPNVTVTATNPKMVGMIAGYIGNSKFSAYGYYTFATTEFNWIAIGRWK